MSLGPVIRNVLAGQHTMILKDDLALRLERAEERDNGLGALIQRDGKLAFVPNYAGDQPVPKLQPYKEPAYVPFQGENAVFDPNPKAKSTERTRELGTGLPDRPFQRGDKVRVTTSLQELLALGVDKRAAHRMVAGELCEFLRDDKDHLPMVVRLDGINWYLPLGGIVHAEAPAPAKPKKYEPKLGDIVHVSTESNFHSGKTGKVVQLDTDGTTEVEADGRRRWVMTKYLSLVESKPAFDPVTEPLRVGDRVKCVYSCSYKGKEGVITALDEHSQERKFRVKFDGAKEDTGNFWSADSDYRSRWQLIERPNT